MGGGAQPPRVMAHARTTFGEDRGADAADAELPPGPDGLPLLGNTLSFLRDPFAFYDAVAEHGDVVRYRVGGYDFTTLLHPEHVEQVLVAEEATFGRAEIQRQSGIDFLENGLSMTEGERWRRQRTAMQPMFYRERVGTYDDAMADHAVRAVEGWADGETVDVVEEISAMTLDVLAETLFDADVGRERAVIREASRAMQERADATGLSAFLPSWVPTPTKRRFECAVADFDDVVGDLIDRRRRAGDAPERDDLLSVLLAAEFEDGSRMDEATLRDQLMNFLLAGHETSSLALSYALLELAKHPDAAARLRAELDSVLDGDRPTAADVPRLEYTEAAIREAMRLHPPVYVIFRQPVRDAVVGGHRIPADTTITLPVFEIHRDPRFWDEPDAFRPERWLDERERPEYAYFPFGGGPHHCIGMRFAMLEMQLSLAALCSRVEFELRSDPDPEFAMGVTMRPTEPIRMRVERR